MLDAAKSFLDFSVTSGVTFEFSFVSTVTNVSFVLLIKFEVLFAPTVIDVSVVSYVFDVLEVLKDAAVSFVIDFTDILLPDVSFINDFLFESEFTPRRWRPSLSSSSSSAL